MKEKLQVLSVIFCMAMCLLLVPVTVYAAEEKTEITEIKISFQGSLYAGEAITMPGTDLEKLVSVTTTPANALSVGSAGWKDMDLGCFTDEVVEGHNYSLVAMFIINDGFYAKEDSENSQRFGGNLIINGKAAYDTELYNQTGMILVYFDEITAKPAPFIKQPVGGVAKQGELYEISFDTGSINKDIFMWRWNGSNWIIYSRYGTNGKSGTLVAPFPGDTVRYKMSINDGDRYVYGDEFEIIGGSDYFTTQPVGGTSEGGKPYTITFDHACKNYATVKLFLEKYDQAEAAWVKQADFGVVKTSYDIPYGTKGKTDKYRLGINNGAGIDVNVYSDEFEVTWGSNIFAKQPLGGKCPIGEAFNFDFALKDYADTATFTLQMLSSKNVWQTVGNLEAPYTIAAKSTEGSNRYRIKCTYNDNVFYSNTFTVEWTTNFFSKQPEGGYALVNLNKSITYRFVSPYVDATVLEQYNENTGKWEYLRREFGNSDGEYSISRKSYSVGIEKYRIRATVNEGDIYSDEFEINWIENPFKTQPVGGKYLFGTEVPFNYELFVEGDSVVLQEALNYHGSWGDVTTITSGFSMTADWEFTATYRLKLIKNGYFYYSDEFTLEFVKEIIIPKIQKDDLIKVPERIVVGSVLEDDDVVVETDDDFLYGYIEGYLTWVYTSATGEVAEYCYYPASDYYKFVVTKEMSHGSVHIELYNENKSAIWVSREVTFDDIHNFEDGACTICGEKYKTGLTYYNGNWYYFVDNEVDTTKTDIVFYKDVWYYVQDGVLNKAYAGLVEHAGKLWYVSNGKLDKTFGGFVAYDGKTYLVKNGTVDTTATGFKLAGEKWAKVINGVVDDAYTGLYYYNNDWWYLINGFLDKTFKGVTPMNGKLWFVRNGKISRENGITEYDGNIYWITNGAVDTSVTDLKYNGGDGKWYYFRQGKVDWTYNTLAYANNRWWYINNGILDKTYTGLVLFRDQLWYVTEGLLDKAYVGTCEYQGKTYSVANGIGTLIK